MTGILIALEGPDCSGTTRHTRMLYERLLAAGKETILTTEPTEGPIGQEIRTLLHGNTLPAPDTIQLMFCADRAEHVNTVIEPALREGRIVITDRYALSTIIYGSVMGLDEQWLRSINARFPTPDLTIITLPPYDVCVERMMKRKKLDQFEQNGFPKKIYEAYAAVDDPATIFVDTSGSKQQVGDEIWNKVQEYFGEVSRERISEL